MKFKVLVLIILSLYTINIHAQNIPDSLYEIAWNRFNEEKYSEAALLFEAAIDAGKDWAGTHLNAASSWAYANNKEKTFEHLFKMVNGGYLDKEFVLIWFSEFYKYHDLKEWGKLMDLFDLKRSEFYQYAFKSEFQKLEKEKMYSDFHSLVKNVVAISPHLKIREKVCNIDYDSLFKNLRNELEKCNSVDTFALILYRTLISCQDGHTSFTSLNPFEYLSNGENLEFCASIAKYELLFNSVMITSVNLPQLVYHQGNYFVSEDYKYKGFNIPKKTELVKVNSLRPQEYIRLNIDRKRSLSWDFENNCFFSETFLQQNIASDTVIELTFKLRNELISFPVKLDIGYTPKKITTIENGFVWYWAENQILYIRMPKMVNSAYYVNEIQNHADKTIKKIIIDIRQNPGGSDNDWEDVLNAITPLNLSIKADYAYTNYFMENDKELKEYQKMPEFGLAYKTVERNIGVGKDESINYSGIIYILYDNSTFSAAGSLVNACYYSDKLISVGQSTGRILGFGIDPKNFQLPNSKLNYRIAPVLDITNIQDYKDIFHDKPELNVNLSLDEKIILKSNPYNIKFLKTNDPYVKYILQIDQ